MKISKFIHTTSKENIFHSHDLAKVSGGATLGSTSAETSNQRRHVDRNRQTVGHYRDSMIVQIQRAPMDIMSVRGEPIGDNKATRKTHGYKHAATPRRGVHVPPRTTFKEPPLRGYNPYS